MKILLDECLPRDLRKHLLGHVCGTVPEAGLAGKTNGELLTLAERSGWQVLLTMDRGMPYQQNLAGRRLALVVISTNDWTRIRKSKAAVLDAITKVSPGSFLEVEIPFH